MANNQEPLNKQESHDSIVSNIRKKLGSIQKELNSLKNLNHEADVINLNRQRLIEDLEKINTSLKEINLGTGTTDYGSVADAYHPQESTSNVLKFSVIHSRPTIQMRFYTDKITENLEYIKNINKEISKINREIDDLKMNNSAFIGSTEEKDSRIQTLQQKQIKLKEELFNFVIITMDHNYEYKELVGLLEAENNAMEEEIRTLAGLVEELKEQNRSLVHENKKIKNLHVVPKRSKTSISSYGERKSDMSMISFTVEELAEGEKHFLSSDCTSLGTTSVNSRYLDAKVDKFLSKSKMQLILNKIQEDYNTMNINHAKLENIKKTFKIKGPGLINLHTKIDPRVYVTPASLGRVPT